MQKQYTSVSLDLETLSTKQNSVILSIGACTFSTEERAIDAEGSLYLKLNPDKQWDRHVCDDTIKWWSQQHSEVQNQTFGGSLRPHEAMQRLVEWLPKDTRKVYCRGVNFDIAILQNMLEAQGMETPWKFWAPQELRTLEYIATRLGVEKAPRPTEGFAHNALEDAMSQASSVIYYHEQLGL